MVKQTRLEVLKTRRRRPLQTMLPRANNNQQSVVTRSPTLTGKRKLGKRKLGMGKTRRGHTCSGQVMGLHKDRRMGPYASPAMQWRPTRPWEWVHRSCLAVPLEDTACWEAASARGSLRLERMKTCAGCVITQSRSTLRSCLRRWKTKSLSNWRWSRRRPTQTEDACLSSPTPCSERAPPARLYRPAARRVVRRCTEFSRAWRPKACMHMRSKEAGVIYLICVGDAASSASRRYRQISAKVPAFSFTGICRLPAFSEPC